MADNTLDALVIGGGPVGLMAAAELRRHGVAARVVDAADGPATTSRALNLHARTLEVLDALGLVDEVLARGRETVAFERHAPGRALQRYEFAHRGRDTRYDTMLVLDQVITEEVLRGHLARLGGEVEWGTRLLDLVQDGAGVEATLATGDGTERVRTRWLVGCDGAHSIVRKRLGIPLAGDANDTWLVADAWVDTDLDPRAAHWLHAPEGAMMMFAFPEPGKWRLVDTAAHPGSDTDPDVLAAGFGRRLADATGYPVRVDPPFWSSLFTIQQRSAPRMNQGRCLLAGDAAHVHSPAGGQGMNTGLQDAANLGWKLAAVIHDQADPALLDTYSAERVPIGVALLDSTRSVTDYVIGDGLLDARQDALAATGRTIIDAANGLGVAYPASPLTVPAPGVGRGPAPGERIAQVDARRAGGAGWRAVLDRLGVPAWTLLHLGAGAPPPLPGSFGSWGGVLAVDDPDLADDLGAAPGDWLLVRPDGYVAARGAADTPVPTPAGYRVPAVPRAR